MVKTGQAFREEVLHVYNYVCKEEKKEETREKEEKLGTNKF